MIAKHLTYTFILTCCQLTLIYCPYFCVMFTIRSVILNTIPHNNSIIAKCFVLSNMISIVSDNILHICIQEPLLILKNL